MVRGDTVLEGVAEAERLLDELREAGVDYDDVVQTLEVEGVDKFVAAVRRADRRHPRPSRASWHGLATESRDARRADLVARPDGLDGPRRGAAGSAGSTRRRAGSRTSTSCSRSPTQVEGAIDDVVLLGMGGSSLAPEVLRQSFGGERFHVLDTTHPAAIRALQAKLDLERTLFISASKSGGDARDALAHRLLLEARAARARSGSRSPTRARRSRSSRASASSRAIFPGEPTIGGRYSALSPFGLVPAALLGVDLRRLLERALEMAEACRLGEGNPGLELGLSLGHSWEEGRDKVCVPDPHGFGLWVEQLVAESTGKEGKGLVPAPGESPDGPDRQAQEVRARVAVRARPGVLPLGVRRRGRRLDPRHQPVRPAERAGGEGQDERGARGRRRRARATRARSTSCSPRREERDYVCIQAFVEPDAGRRRGRSRGSPRAPARRPAAS